MSLEMPRRSAIKISALAGGGLALAWLVGESAQGNNSIGDPAGALLPPGGSAPVGAQADAVLLSPFMKLYPDNRMEFVLDRVEMGQGTATSQAMLLCEELDFPFESISVLHATAHKDYINTKFGSQMTGGSTSVVEGHEKLRTAGAQVRERLRLAAAAGWRKPVEDVIASQGKLSLRSEPKTVATYGEFASQAAAFEAREVVLKPWSEHRLIGTSPKRLDAKIKSNGKAVFGIDAAPPGSAVAVLVRPPRVGLEPSAIDATAALALPGVLKVIAAAGGVAVIADRYWQARSAAASIKVTWNQSQGAQPFDLDTEALRAIHLEAAKSPGRSHRSDGDWANTYRGDALKVLADYEVPYLAHATMEPQNASCVLREPSAAAAGGLPLVEVWAGSQVPDLAVSEVAEFLGCKRQDVVFHNTYLGGGFGRRLTADYILEAIAIAQAATDLLKGRPLQLVFSREDDMKHDDFRPMAAVHMLGSLDKNKKLSSFFYRCASQSILRQYAPDLVQTMVPGWVPQGVSRLAASLVSRFAGPAVSLEGAKDFPYVCPNVEVEYAEVDLPVRVGFWRSVGHSISGFAVESFIDELAHIAGEDPYRFRKAHLQPGDRRAGVLDRVAQISGWGNVLPQGVFEGIAVHKSFDTYVAQVCRVSVSGSAIKVHEVFCVVDCGRAIHPENVKAQIESGVVYGLSAALSGEVDFAAGSVVQGNFDDYPVLRHDACPVMVTEILESTAEPTGVGEPGTPPIAAALCNAVFKATGKRIRALPLSRSLLANK